MDIFLDKLQPAVKEESQKLAAAMVFCVAAMWFVFAALHTFDPGIVPFDYTVFLGGVGGGFVAVLNFFLMGAVVQKAVEEDNEERARLLIRSSYSRRMLLQMTWVIIVIILPCFQTVAGIIPLLFPGFILKVKGMFSRITYKQRKGGNAQ